MQRVEDAKPRPARDVQNLEHVRNTAVRFGDGFDPIPYLAALRNKIVVGINDKKCRYLFVVGKCCWCHNRSALRIAWTCVVLPARPVNRPGSFPRLLSGNRVSSRPASGPGTQGCEHPPER